MQALHCLWQCAVKVHTLFRDFTCVVSCQWCSECIVGFTALGPHKLMFQGPVVWFGSAFRLVDSLPPLCVLSGVLLSSRGSQYRHTRKLVLCLLQLVIWLCLLCTSCTPTFHFRHRVPATLLPAATVAWLQAGLSFQWAVSSKSQVQRCVCPTVVVPQRRLTAFLYLHTSVYCGLRKLNLVKWETCLCFCSFNPLTTGPVTWAHSALSLLV